MCLSGDSLLWFLVSLCLFVSCRYVLVPAQADVQKRCGGLSWFPSRLLCWWSVLFGCLSAFVVCLWLCRFACVRLCLLPCGVVSLGLCVFGLLRFFACAVLCPCVSVCLFVVVGVPLRPLVCSLACCFAGSVGPGVCLVCCLCCLSVVFGCLPALVVCLCVFVVLPVCVFVFVWWCCVGVVGLSLCSGASVSMRRGFCVSLCLGVHACLLQRFLECNAVPKAPPPEE